MNKKYRELVLKSKSPKHMYFVNIPEVEVTNKGREVDEWDYRLRETSAIINKCDYIATCECLLYVKGFHYIYIIYMYIYMLNVRAIYYPITLQATGEEYIVLGH